MCIPTVYVFEMNIIFTFTRKTIMYPWLLDESVHHVKMPQFYRDYTSHKSLVWNSSVARASWTCFWITSVWEQLVIDRHTRNVFVDKLTQTPIESRAASSTVHQYSTETPLFCISLGWGTSLLITMCGNWAPFEPARSLDCHNDNCVELNLKHRLHGRPVVYTGWWCYQVYITLHMSYSLIL